MFDDQQITHASRMHSALTARSGPSLLTRAFAAAASDQRYDLIGCSSAIHWLHGTQGREVEKAGRPWRRPSAARGLRVEG